MSVQNIRYYMTLFRVQYRYEKFTIRRRASLVVLLAIRVNWPIIKLKVKNIIYV